MKEKPNKTESEMGNLPINKHTQIVKPNFN